MFDHLKLNLLHNDKVAADLINLIKHVRVKLTLGNEGVDDGDVSEDNPLPVVIVSGASGGLDSAELLTLLLAYFVNPTISVSTGYEASRQALAVPGNLISITGYNSKATAQFIQIHNAVSEPAEGAVPADFFIVPPGSSFIYTPNDQTGDHYTAGIYVCNSLTGPTKSIGSPDCWFRVRVRADV